MAQLSAIPGKMRHRADVYSVSYIRKPTGQAKESFTKIGTVWCQIEIGSAKEIFKSAELQEYVAHVVFVRRQDYEFNPSMWLVIQDAPYASKRFDIRGVEQSSGIPQFVKLDCREIVGAAGPPDQ